MSENHGLDTDQQIFFYEQDYYIFSNFSAFNLFWSGVHFDTSEAAYHWEKFRGQGDILAKIREAIHQARSAHDAFKAAQEYKKFARADWDEVKFDVMKQILHAKVAQHDYVYKKLMASGNRELVENSWRDPVWGWGPNKDGQNMLGKLWMEVREELRNE